MLQLLFHILVYLNYCCVKYIIRAFSVTHRRCNVRCTIRTFSVTHHDQLLRSWSSSSPSSSWVSSRTTQYVTRTRRDADWFSRRPAPRKATAAQPWGGFWPPTHHTARRPCQLRFATAFCVLRVCSRERWDFWSAVLAALLLARRWCRHVRPPGQHVEPYYIYPVYYIPYDSYSHLLTRILNYRRSIVIFVSYVVTVSNLAALSF